MRVIKKTGLVPITDLRTNSVYGVSPKKAAEMVAKKIAELHDIPEGVETFETTTAPRAEGAAAPAAPAAPPPPPAETEDVEVVIPENWEGEHHLQRIALAKKILAAAGSPAERLSSEEADAAIRDEIARRSAEQEPPSDNPQATAA